MQSNYERYGAPRVEQTIAYSQQEWQKSLKPKLENGQARVAAVYRTSLGPHVDKVTVAISPYYDKMSNVAATKYTTIVLPSYERARPYAIKAYDQGAHFATEVGLPYSRWVTESTIIFIQRRVWPPIRILYGENVQPQLIKIRERLANYRDSESIEAAVEAEDSALSSSTSFASNVGSSQSTASSSIFNSMTAMMSSPQATQPASTSASDNILDDLVVWKHKFTRAAEEGASGLRERIGEISNGEIHEQVEGTGEALVTSLEETAKYAISTLKSDIISVVSSLLSHEDETEVTSNDVENAQVKARDAVRVAGKRVKDDAQKLRSWRNSYNEDLQRLIDAAANSTLDVVDSIREAGLQEIGMRWASMDGVTYKDWSEYHALRKSFDEWRETLHTVVSEHEAPTRARRAAEQVEDRGMAVAEDAAKELARLKDIANWKVESQDASEDFSTKYTPPGAARAAQKAMKKADEAIQRELSHDPAQSFTSKVSQAAESVAQQAESTTAKVVKSASSATSPAIEKVNEAVSAASSKASAATESTASSSSSVSSQASSKASSVADFISKSSTNPSSSASDTLSSASSKASSVAELLSSSGSSVAVPGSSSLSSDAESASLSAASRASSISSRAAASRSSLAEESGVTPEYGLPPDTDYGRSKIAEERKKYEAQRDAKAASAKAKKAVEQAVGKGDAHNAAGTVVPGTIAEDTIAPIASVSASIASAVNAAGSGYKSITNSIDRVEKMRSSVSAADD